MNNHNNVFALTGVSAAAILLAACSATPVVDPSAARARTELTTLQSNPHYQGRAELAVKDAEDAVAKAETPREDPSEAAYYGYIAERQVATAEALAAKSYSEDQIKQLGEQREQIRLDARNAQIDALKKELAAKETDRGLVLTLGDVLFETGKADLKPGAAAGLDQLVGFLDQQPERSVMIEGHTDSVGAEGYNMTLSQQRADAVKAYLVGRGISPQRVMAVGKGEALPVASNGNAAGRQQNRRVEVIVENAPQQG
jgi:outer membrane protein OmpA-like peptidoglycan-associated protein